MTEGARVAAVDVGTNTALLLIAEVRGGELVSADEQMEIVRLGQGVDATGRLDPQAIERTARALAGYGERIRAAKVARAGAVGTQALREVANGAAFLERARGLLGFPIEVIDGPREAHLSWRAVAASFPLSEGARRTVVDIGGGSTELIVGGAAIEHAVSVPIGSVRLTERLLAHDPPTHAEMAALDGAIDQALDSAPRPEGELWGVAGTVTTLCALSLALADYDGRKVHGQRLARAEVERQLARMAALPLDERKRLPGLDPRRADVIVAGAAILARVMARAGAAEVGVSDRGIRWGLAFELAGEVATPSRSR